MKIPVVGTVGSAWSACTHLSVILAGLGALLLGHLVLIESHGTDYLERMLAGEVIPEALVGLIGFPMLVIFVVGYLFLRKPRRR